MNLFDYKKLGSVARLLPVALLLAGCASGPTVFQGTNNLRVVTAAPGKKITKPSAEMARVRLTGDHIEITEKVFFEFDKAIIKSESHSLLNEVAKVMKDNAHVKHVRVEGHASLEKDTPEKRAYNKNLSAQRAKAVMAYLIAQGVATDRLESEGYGAEKPIASNDDDAGRKKNRRVEFLIVKQDSH